MERRGFFRAILGLGVAVVCAPMAEAVKSAPATNPIVVGLSGGSTSNTIGGAGGCGGNLQWVCHNITYYQDQITLIVDDGEIGYGDVTVK